MPDFEVWADKDDAGKHANGSYELSINGDVPDPPLSAGFGPTFGSPHGGTGPQCAIGYNTESYLYVSSESNVYEDGDLTDQPIIFFKYPSYHYFVYQQTLYLIFLIMESWLNFL